MRSRKSRRWTAASPCCPCDLAMRLDAATITSAMASHRCLPPSTSPRLSATTVPLGGRLSKVLAGTASHARQSPPVLRSGPRVTWLGKARVDPTSLLRARPNGDHDHQRRWQRFQGQSRKQAAGLGLVRRLVEQVRGTATVDSENGTVWTIKIPRLPTALQLQSYPIRLARAKKRPEALPGGPRRRRSS
jgi:hypothetical protein